MDKNCKGYVPIVILVEMINFAFYFNFCWVLYQRKMSLYILRTSFAV